MSDFIVQNYKKCKLFYDQGHPTDFVMKEKAIRILSKLGIDDKEIHSELKLNRYEDFIYPCVMKCLDMTWQEQELRNGKKGRKLAHSMDVKEYIKDDSGGYFYNNKWYSSPNDILNDNHIKKRIYTVDEANKVAKKTNTFKIKYK